MNQPVNFAGANSLSRREILRGRKSIQKVLLQKPLFTEYLRMHFLPACEKKAGFFVPKRTGKAVARNLYKRRMREIYRCMKQAFPKGKLVFIIRGTPDWKRLRRQFDLAARKLNERYA